MISRVILLLLLVVSATSSKDEDSTDEKITSATEKIVDRLAVNLAGAFVKSVFPEMDRRENVATPTATNEVRRAPMSPLAANLENYSPTNLASEYNIIPQQKQFGEAPRNPFAYQSQQIQSAAYSAEPQQQMIPSYGAMAGKDFPNLLANGPGTPEAINSVRNQAYLAELAKHQSELTAYSAKQMEYLDQQRRYQQAMIDHQAGAALLMQKQQQEIIQEQIKKMKESYNAGEEETPSNDNTLGGRILTAKAHGAKTMKIPVKSQMGDDDIDISDDHLKNYFKQKYGIDISDDVNNLTADERETLRDLKKELMKQKENAIQNGSFAAMNNLKSKVLRRKGSSASRNEGSCGDCIPVNSKMLNGAWTQVYGNPKVVNDVFATVMSLEKINATETITRMSKKKTACVGMEVGVERRRKCKLNLFFRDNLDGNELHEMRGTVSIRNDIISVETNLYRTQMCLVKSGPSDAGRFEYIILLETTGKNACSSFHVFARDIDEFNRRYFDDASDFMNKKTESGALPVGALPKASLCQLDRP